jgi:hypothetical protein
MDLLKVPVLRWILLPLSSAYTDDGGRRFLQKLVPTTRCRIPAACSVVFLLKCNRYVESRVKVERRPLSDLAVTNGSIQGNELGCH